MYQLYIQSLPMHVDVRGGADLCIFSPQPDISSWILRLVHHVVCILTPQLSIILMPTCHLWRDGQVEWLFM